MDYEQWQAGCEYGEPKLLLKSVKEEEGVKTRNDLLI